MLGMDTVQQILPMNSTMVTNFPPLIPVAAQQLTDMFGIIFPPNEIKAIIDKTASFVAKNGPEFEQRVLSDTANAQKFSFLLLGNPYRAYYDAKVNEIRTGQVNEATQLQMPHAIAEIKRKEEEKKMKNEKLLALTSYATQPHFITSTSDSQVLSKLFDINDSIPNVNSIDDDRPPTAPPDDQFIVTRPFATALDVDIIKLTAQYAARNGQKFLAGLSQRERGNPQFCFLRTTHPLFNFFTSLVDAYSRCLVPSKTIINTLKEDIGLEGRFSSSKLNNKEFELIKPLDVINGNKIISGRQMNGMLGILERVEARHVWESYEEKKKQEQARKEAEERQQMHAIDWHEFTVVEVINFTEEDDKLPLGPPITQASLMKPVVVPPLAHHSIPFNIDYSTSIIPDVSNIMPPFPTSNIPTLIPEVSQPILPLMPTVHPPSNQILTSTSLPQGGFSNSPPEPPTASLAPIVVIKGYVRQGKRRQRETSGMQKCPITGELVPVENMSEHLRVLLLDPKWKEQKDILLEKAQKESAFAPSSDIEANLANFVVKRPDLFGTVEDECESNYVPSTKRK